ncbi:hypothetical protein KPN8_171 [Klebsiella phage KPN8]|nr:hypothetical protein KPN8_171 [Klebsiella phage KPN8]
MTPTMILGSCFVVGGFIFLYVLIRILIKNSLDGFDRMFIAGAGLTAVGFIIFSAGLIQGVAP